MHPRIRHARLLHTSFSLLLATFCGACVDAPDPDVSVDGGVNPTSDGGVDLDAIAEWDGGVDLDVGNDSSVPDAADTGDALGAGSCVPAPPAAPAPSEAIASLLAGLEGWTRLPLPTVDMGEGIDNYGEQDQRGPVHRDFSNVMHYSPARGVAFYAGGSHGTYRGNDVWEFSLARNAWRSLSGEGGNHAPFASVIHNAMKDREHPLPTDRAIDDEWMEANWTPDQQDTARRFKRWWQRNGAIVEGRARTRAGGPILPSHQWDSMAFDEATGDLVWMTGAFGMSPRTSFIAWLEDLSYEEADERLHGGYGTWTFNRDAQRWSIYERPDGAPTIAGMGTSLTYIPDECQLIYYAAARNVVPSNFGMHRWDRASDAWETLIDGATLERLVDDGQAPRAEAQFQYVAADRTLYAAQGPDLFAYGLDDGEWRHLVSDERIDAHDGYSVFAYDTHRRLLYWFRHVPGAGARFAAFDLASGEWEMLETGGYRAPPWGGVYGYFDPHLGVFYIMRGQNFRAWAYRHPE